MQSPQEVQNNTATICSCWESGLETENNYSTSIILNDHSLTWQKASTTWSSLSKDAYHHIF